MIATEFPSTPQAFFDTAASHMLSQGCKAVDLKTITEENECCYRTRDISGKVLACGVGACIPDHMYSYAFEGATAIDVLADLDDLHGIFRGHDEYTIDLWHVLASEIQAIHDESLVNQWPSMLREIALKHELSTAVLDAA